MFDIRYEYMRLVATSACIEDMHRTPWVHGVLYTLPGYSVSQHLNWKWPVICKGTVYVPDDAAEFTIARRGGVYQLYRDANDVAGLSKYFADRGKAKV